MQQRETNTIRDVIIIGAGQSALACGYYLRRTDLDYLILDKGESCGGAWRHAWDSLSLFSPAEQSSLPGWLMPRSAGDFPNKKEVIDYLCQYEKRYHLNIQRPVEVLEVIRDEDYFVVRTQSGEFRSRTVISATGTWSRPFIPDMPGRDVFRGEQLHSAEYRQAERFMGKKVLIVGEGNSGAQILAEVSKLTETTWATREKPDFLPDDVDGRVLFNVASAKYYAEKRGESYEPAKFSLGNIVMLPSVKEARERGVLKSKGSFSELYEDGVVWDSGEKEAYDAVIWCTGFHFATSHLSPLVTQDSRGKVSTRGTRATEMPGLWLVGYGGWTGFASATLIGVGRSARKTVSEINDYLEK